MVTSGVSRRRAFATAQASTSAAGVIVRRCAAPQTRPELIGCEANVELGPRLSSGPGALVPIGQRGYPNRGRHLASEARCTGHPKVRDLLERSEGWRAARL